VLSAALLAGFFAAHAVWSVSDGETLVPIYAYVDASGQRHMDRLVADTLEQSVNAGRKRLSDNPDHAAAAVLIVDGYIPLSGTKTDSLILEVRIYGDSPKNVTMAVPYVPPTANVQFKVYRPKILEFPTGEDAQSFTESFWKGVEAHTKGAEVWNSHIDQTK
jgi:hypothetical protein